MSRSIARAVLNDATSIAANTELERIAACDRAMVLTQSGRPMPKIIIHAPVQAANDELELELIGKLGALYVDCPCNGDTSVAGEPVLDQGGEPSA